MSHRETLSPKTTHKTETHICIKADAGNGAFEVWLLACRAIGWSLHCVYSHMLVGVHVVLLAVAAGAFHLHGGESEGLLNDWGELLCCLSLARG